MIGLKHYGGHCMTKSQFPVIIAMTFGKLQTLGFVYCAEYVLFATLPKSLLV